MQCARAHTRIPARAHAHGPFCTDFTVFFCWHKDDANPARQIHSAQNCPCLHLLDTLQHPGMWHKRNGEGLHSGLAALASRSESSRTVHSVSRMSRGVVVMAPVHAALRTNNEFVY